MRRDFVRLVSPPGDGHPHLLPGRNFSSGAGWEKASSPGLFSWRHMQPHPEPSEPFPVEPARKLFCKRYDECLDHADRERWPSFTCRECRVEELIQWTPEEAEQEFHRCVVLWIAALHPWKTRFMQPWSLSQHARELLDERKVGGSWLERKAGRWIQKNP